MERLSKLNSAALLALSFLIVNSILRIWFIASQDVAMDEPFSIFWAQQSLSEIWHLAAFENNPPLHFFIEHFWIKFFGIEALSIRFPSLVFSVLGIAVLVYTLAKKQNLFTAFIAGLLLTLSTEHVYYSHEARAYSLLFFLTVLAFKLSLDLIRDAHNKRTYLALALVNILLIYTHYLSIWVIIAELSIWFIYCRSFTAFKTALLSIFIVSAGFVPLAYAAFQRLSLMLQTGTWVKPAEISQLYGHINILLNGVTGTIGFISACIIIVLSTLYFKKKIDLEALASPDFIAASIWFLIIYLGIYFQSILFQPVFIPRYLYFSSVPLFAAMALFIGKLSPNKSISLLSILIITIGMIPGYSLNPENHRKMRDLTEYINSIKDTETALVIAPKSFNLAYLYYGNRAIFQKPESYQNELLNNHIYPIDHFDQLPDSLNQNAKRIIFLDADAQFILPNNSIFLELEKKYQLKSKSHFHQIMDVYVFEP
jgi:mannosyltransferase